MKINAIASMALSILIIASCTAQNENPDTATAEAIGIWEGKVYDKKGTILNRFEFRDDMSYTWSMIKKEAFDLYGWDPNLATSRSGTWSVDKDKASGKSEDNYYLIVTPYEKQYVLGELITNKLIYEGELLQVYNFRGVQIGLLLSKMD